MLNWFLDPNRQHIPCGQVGKSGCLDLTNGAPDCIKCGYRTTDPENIWFIELIFKYSMFFFDGMGGISLSNIYSILEQEDIEFEDFMSKFIIYLQIREDKRSGSTNNSSV